MTIIPYVNFYGNCEEALAFYKIIFNAEVKIQRYSDMISSEDIPIEEENKHKVMHGILKIKNNLIYCCDNLTSPPIKENRVTFTIEFDSEEELDDVYAALSATGTTKIPLQYQYLGGKFGSVTDKFGFYWALNFTE